MPTNPTPIDALPTPPSRSDPVNFAARGDALLGALPAWTDDINDIAEVTFNNATDSFTAASNASGFADVAFTQAAAAAQSATAAAASAGATKWISGTTYTEGNVVWSPLTFLSYRRKITGGGTTDPSLETTNWALVGAPSSFPVSLISSNTNAAASNHYIFTAALTLTLPSTPPVGTTVQWTNLSDTMTCIIDPGSEKIRNVAGTMTVNVKNASVILVYTGATLGWV